LSIALQLGALTGSLADAVPSAGHALKQIAPLASDDLAIKTLKVTGVGVKQERELSVIFEVAKGAVKSKMIIIPAALGLSVVAPWAISPAACAAGVLLSYEAVEKISHALMEHFNKAAEGHDAHVAEVELDLSDPVQYALMEEEAIDEAIETDAIMAVEATAVALGTLKDLPLLARGTALTMVGAAMTAGVYTAVAALSQMDNLGRHLLKGDGEGLLSKLKRFAGHAINKTSPKLMKFLQVGGLAAMFLIGGQIINHNIPFMHHVVEHLKHMAHDLPMFGHMAGFGVSAVMGCATSMVAGYAANKITASQAFKNAFNKVKDFTLGSIARFVPSFKRKMVAETVARKEGVTVKDSHLPEGADHTNVVVLKKQPGTEDKAKEVTGHKVTKAEVKAVPAEKKKEALSEALERAVKHAPDPNGVPFSPYKEEIAALDDRSPG